MSNDEFYILNCPNCEDMIIIHKNELNCCIFRHAAYKHNMEPINPHTSKEDCKALLESDKVFGCCLPFRVIIENGSLKSEKCDYI